MRTYRPIRFGEHPEYIVEFIEMPQIDAPYGSRGAGEHGLIGMPAALANFFREAVLPLLLVDGIPIKSFMMLAIETVGKEITTIEGLRNTPIQRAFIEHFAFQCGYCTPGFIMNAYALTEQHPDADDSTIQEWLESNICRCTSYQEIEEAVKSVLMEKRKNE
ncbi:2Fe-2S iron-sulfur cluster-binding protein [Parageobacillus toebii]|uniref:(2Fe-2S)-binding protein n=1 Tax=Parageobacillus toebii TaxID=153151 RepID=UPI0035C669E7